ncbi:MAG: hypothetical protein ACP5KE_07385 [Candidatus Methanodesulfokora sp.]|jgi:hypothetical protein|nr:MAG: hypothetical protein C0200_00105 [Candidatus Korarchaeota archaeon]
MDRFQAGIFAILIFQLVVLAYIFYLDPITSQNKFAAGLSAELTASAIILYLYKNIREDYDQEWIAAGIAFIILALLLMVFYVR